LALASATSSFASLASSPGLVTRYIAVRPIAATGARSFEGWNVVLNSDGLAVSTEVGATSSV
jgi:hypothetical protein